jgi:CHAD domain-containing protein
MSDVRDASEAGMARQELMFAASGDPSEVVEALTSRYTVIAEPSLSLRWFSLDTVDWRLHRAGMTLRDARRGRTSELVLVDDAGERITAPTQAGSWPRRLNGKAPSAVVERIAAAVGVRALLSFAEVEVRRIPLRLVDAEQKTRVRVRVDQQRLIGPRRAPLPLRVVVTPLRGYERDARRCAELLSARMPPLTEQAGFATVALTAAGHAPGTLVGRGVALDPGAPAVRSIAQVLLGWLDVIDATWPGVLEDIDPEFLHELRTAVRATRSMLTLCGSLIPNGHAERFAAEFAWLGAITTPVRDLDVNLLQLAGEDDLDLSGLHDLDPLRQHLLRRRRIALRALRDEMRGPRGSRLVADWRAVLGRLVTAEVPGPSTVSVAGAQARLAYRRIVKAAAPVTATTHADHLHSLRRRCKRMRYLLDGFASVYEPQAQRDVVSALKKLQDCLGDIQDSDVQRRQLATTAGRMVARAAPVDTVLAMGALQDRIARRDADARAQLTARLARFTSARTKARVDSLPVPV